MPVISRESQDLLGVSDHRFFHGGTDAAEHSFNLVHALIVVIAFGDEFNAVPIADAISYEAAHADRTAGVWRRELDRDLSADRQFGSGKDSHASVIEFGAAAGRDRSFGRALGDHPNGDVHFVARPPAHGGISSLREGDFRRHKELPV